MGKLRQEDCPEFQPSLGLSVLWERELPALLEAQSSVADTHAGDLLVPGSLMVSQLPTPMLMYECRNKKKS